MSIQKFETYWLIEGVKITNYQSMKRGIEGGATAIEISATQQHIEADRRKRLARANWIEDEKIRKAAAQRAHDQSPEGQLEAARRTALQNPGGIVSGGTSPLAELDTYSPANTNLLK